MIVHSRTHNELLELFPKDIDRILFVPDLWIHKLIARLSNFVPRRLSVATFGLLNQLLTQFSERKMLRQLIAQQSIDVVHQPIPISPRFPSVMFGLGIPVVIGPMNGGMEYPRAFRSNESWMSRLAIEFLRLFTDAGNTLLPGKKNADVLLVANERTRLALPSGVRGQVIEMDENGIDIELWESASEEVSGSTEQTKPSFLFVGRLVDWKALDIAIRAIANVPSVVLEVVGDGPMLAAWMSLAEELGVSDRVHFLGRRGQSEYAARLRSSIALVLPSLYESGGAVVLEAMASGKPVIATRWGGPSNYLNASCGILVEPDSYASLVAGFSAGMQRLIDSPELARSMGCAGRERAVRNYDWQRRIDKVIGIYSEVAERSGVPRELNESRVSAAVVTERQ